jgi:hypothetical protein
MLRSLRVTAGLAVLLMLLATSVGTGRSALQTYGSAGEKTCADWNSATQANSSARRVFGLLRGTPPASLSWRTDNARPFQINR